MTNVTRLENGPQNFTKKDHEIISAGREKPVDYIFLQPFEYCVIKNPVMRNAKDKSLIFDKHGQVKVKIGDGEIRTHFDYPEPFPLFPGESLSGRSKLEVIPRDCALKLSAQRDVQIGEDKRVAGDEWLEFGPKIYIPKVEVDIVTLIRPITIEPNQAIKVRALRETKDSKGKDRNAGEEWLIRDLGFYIPGINEQIESTEVARNIDDTSALLLEAKQTFVDFYGTERKAGE
jgi:major vault protein